jgi:hypothetical protein
MKTSGSGPAEAFDNRSINRREEHLQNTTSYHKNILSYLDYLPGLISHIQKYPSGFLQQFPSQRPTETDKNRKPSFTAIPS